MAAHVKSSVAQQNFGELMDRALAGEDVVIERYGNPRVTIISFNRYKELVEAARLYWLQQMERISDEVSARHAHLSEDEVDKLIERARSKIHAEQQQP